MIKGFTLPELLASLCILSVIAAISTPSISHMLEKSKVDSDVFEVQNIIQTTRAKAIAGNSYFTICGSQKSDKCSRNWSHLKVIESSEKNTVYQTQFKGNYSSVSWSAFQNKPGLTISPTGYTHHQNGTLYLCHKHNSRLHRSLIVSKSGRVTVGKDSKKLYEKCSVNT